MKYIDLYFPFYILNLTMHEGLYLSKAYKEKKGINNDFKCLIIYVMFRISERKEDKQKAKCLLLICADFK